MLLRRVDALASMRPPQNAGEDTPRGRTAHYPAIFASMRPPQNAGEDRVSAGGAFSNNALQ